MSKEGCPKCIGGVDKDGESDHLDGKMLVFKIKQKYQSEVIEGNSQLHQKHELELNVLRLVWKNKERLSELISKAAREDLRRSRKYKLLKCILVFELLAPCDFLFLTCQQYKKHSALTTEAPEFFLTNINFGKKYLIKLCT